MKNLTLPPVISSFSTIAPNYDLLLCDIWGVVHNGVSAHPQACAALQAYRKQGGTVVLVSNAPRPSHEIIEQLKQFGVPDGVFDGIVTSGDVTVRMVADRKGQPLHHIGPERDIPMFDALGVSRVGLEAAEYVVCTGLFEDEVETPDDYRPTITAMHQAGLPMICANPDLVVERGHRIIYCAGAIADAYALMGGEVAYAGKPHRPIYDMAIAEAERIRGAALTRSRILAIGDAIRTDVTGARGIGVDVIFVAAGIHSAELLDSDDRVGPTQLEEFLGSVDLAPDYVMRNLVW